MSGEDTALTPFDLASSFGSPSIIAFYTRVADDAYNRLEILADGTILQGDGTVPPTEFVGGGGGGPFTSDDITDFQTAVEDIVGFLDPGTDIDIAYEPLTNTNTISFTGDASTLTVDDTDLSYTAATVQAALVALDPLLGGTPDVTDLGYTAATRVLTSSTGADVTLPLADGSNPGLLASADFTALAGLSASLALKAPLASPTFTGTVTVANGAVLGTPASATLTNATGLPQAGVVNLVSDLANKQPLDTDLTALAALTPTNGQFIKGNGSAFVVGPATDSPTAKILKRQYFT